MPCYHSQPKPPKTKKAFGRTTAGRNKKPTPSTNTPSDHGVGGTLESSDATGLKDLPWDKLLRKARDLLKLKEHHLTVVSTLRSDIKLLQQESIVVNNQHNEDMNILNLAAKEKDDALSAQTQQHNLQLEEERCGHANRISALSILHKEEIEKIKVELRALAKQNFADKKISNEVSLTILIRL